MNPILRWLGVKNNPRLTNKIAKEILSTQPLIAFDIGAAEWLPEHWEKLIDAVQFYAIEPDASAASKLKSKYSIPNYKVINIGLSSTKGEKLLHVPIPSTGASLLPFKFPTGDYFPDLDQSKIGKVKIETDTLSNVLAAENITQANLIKLDTQGSELDILKGLKNEQFRDVQIIETEIGMPGCYVGQPTLNEFQSFLLEHDFELFDLRLSKAHLIKNGSREKIQSLFKVCSNSPTISSRLWEVDAVFIKKKEFILKQDEAYLRKMIVSLCIYNYFLEAVDLVEEFHKSNKISKSLKNELIQKIVALHNAKELKTIYRNSRLMNTLREIQFKFSLKNAPRWHNYIYQNFP